MRIWEQPTNKQPTHSSFKVDGPDTPNIYSLHPEGSSWLGWWSPRDKLWNSLPHDACSVFVTPGGRSPLPSLVGSPSLPFFLTLMWPCPWPYTHCYLSCWFNVHANCHWYPFWPECFSCLIWVVLMEGFHKHNSNQTWETFIAFGFFYLYMTFLASGPLDIAFRGQYFWISRHEQQQVDVHNWRTLSWCKGSEPELPKWW